MTARGLLIAFLVLLWAMEVRAGGTVTVQAENDRIARTDRHYTHGSRLSWVSDEKTNDPAWVRTVLDFLYPPVENKSGRIGFALGHNIYTPEDTEATALVGDDRPYAGWLYGAVSLHAETERKHVDTLDSVELSLGLVGPQAYGADVQNSFHELISVATSKGWHHQLENEPALALFFERKWRPKPLSLGPLEVDGLPFLGGSVGNVFTMADGGVVFRLGQGLDRDWGPPHIRPSLSGLGSVTRAEGFGWYLFAGLEGQGVLRNIFLDGNTFTDSHSVDKEPFVGSVQVGAALLFRGARLAFTHVYRTREFEGQSEADRYGAVSLSFPF